METPSTGGPSWWLMQLLGAIADDLPGMVAEKGMDVTVGTALWRLTTLRKEAQKHLAEAEHMKAAVVGMARELTMATRRRPEEPSPMAFMPVAQAFAAEEISGGRMRELMILWLRGASSEELVALLPKEGDV